MQVACAHCGRPVDKTPSAINRAQREGRRLFCNRKCSGAAKGRGLTPEQRKARKSEYDRQRRAMLGESIKAAKRAAYYANHEQHLAKQAELRARPQNIEKHNAYCRRPGYVAKKADYDRQYRASEYGPFAEAYLILIDLDKEIRSRATAYERRVMNGYYTRNAQMRRRELCRTLKTLNSTPAI